MLVEISDTSLHYDREKKIPTYARADIPEVWSVNALERKIEVYHKPHLTGYGSTKVLGAGDKACPLAFPDVSVEIAELMSSA